MSTHKFQAATLFKSVRVMMAIVLCSQIITPIITNAANVNPFVQTVISVSKDGTVPFDLTTYNGLSNFGKDEDDANGVVRATDIVRYKVEVAVNDAASNGSLIAKVQLDPTNSISDSRQKWISLPSSCELSGSSISLDKQTMICNL